MKVTLADSAGYCPGVDKAVRLALETTEQQNEKVFSLGPIIHNPQVIEVLHSKGVEVVEDLEDIPPGSALIVRSHGLPPEMISSAADLGLNVVDATCAFVRRAQNYARQLFEEGYKVIVVGDADHPEVTAILAHTKYTAVAIRGLNDLEGLTFKPSDKVGIIAQTTQKWENFQACVNALLSRVGELRCFSTICPASTGRQQEAVRLARNNEIVLVVGGRNSANTTNLTNIAKREGARTFHIEGPGEIDPEWFRGVQTVGITAGASTPRWIIEGVNARMDEIKEQEVQKVSEEVPESNQPATEEAVAESEAPQVMTEEALDQTAPRLEKGALVKATVVQVEPERVLVDVGYKTEGIIDRRDLSRFAVSNAQEVVSAGDVFDAVVIKEENEEGQPILSKKKADAEKAWEEILEAKDKEGFLIAKVKSEVKGGLLVDLGVRGFVPASQVSVKYVEDLSQYIGKELKFKILEVDEKRKNVVLSHKEIEEEQQEKARTEVFDTLEEGEIIKGVVKRLTDFGAFVEVKPGVEGLLHVSEIAWERVSHPSDVLSEGEEIEVKVLGVDQDRGRISLGRKQVLPDPWVTLANKVKEGDTIEGTVTRAVDFGAFVRLEAGIEGLVHISELAHHHVSSPEEVVKSGDKVQVRILNIDPDARRVSLSIKQTKPQPKKEQHAPKAQPDAPAPAAEPESGYTIGDRLANLDISNILGTSIKDDDDK